MKPFVQQRSLANERFEVIVIGGGINGVAIARECALARKRVLLLEQHDFGSGTTSRSTRIIHGGLRYLEHGQLGLVRQSLRDRERLLCQRPHLVRPMQFLLAVPPGGRHSALAIRAGLWFYGTMAVRRGAVAAHAPPIERLLDSDKQWALFHYDDAQCEFPERLVAEWLTEATAAGLVARNYTRVIAVDTHFGQVAGVITRDLLDGSEATIAAEWVINATGPWVDRVCASSAMRVAGPLVGPVRGSHLIIPNFTGITKAAVYTEAVDGRPIFFVPWNGRLLVGTTEVVDQGDPARVQPSSEELEYLFHSVKSLFPKLSLVWSDVECGFAGVRPLPYCPATDAAAVTRRHKLYSHADDGAAGMISVVGGKLTTAASLARECMHKIGIRTQEPFPTMAPAPSPTLLESALHEWARQVSAMARISEHSARSLAEWHGRSALRIARAAMADERLRRPICEHTEHVVAEAVNAVENEKAVHLSDIVLRRVPVALGGCWSHECTRAAAERVGAALAWDEERITTELEIAEEERSQFLRRVETPLRLLGERAG